MSQEVSIRDAKSLIEDGATVVDVRERDEYERGHIPDSVSVPMNEFTAHLGDLSDEGSLLMVCEVGEASRQAAMLLDAYGGVESDEVYNLDEGLVEWDGEWVGEKPKKEKSAGGMGETEA